MNAAQMNTTQSQHFSVVVRTASRFALQWRLLLLWLVVLLIPTALAVFPMWEILSHALDHSVYVGDLAHRLDGNSVADIGAVGYRNIMAVSGGGIAGLIVTLLFSPFLSGLAITAAKSAKPLRMGELVHGGLAEYWRLLRMLLLALVPLGIAAGAWAAVSGLASKHAGKVVLESSADTANYAALALGIVLFLIADATVDAGRAQFALSSKRRSAIKAWWRGLKLIYKSPLRSLGSYLLLTLVGLGVAALLGLLRINMPQVGAIGFVAALLVTQIMVASIAWSRSARLFALVQLARAEQAAQ